MKRLVVALAAVAASLTFPATGSAHVHGITPLGIEPGTGLSCHVPANAGANQTNDTPAALANGGPIKGVIPIDVGNAPLTAREDGGFGATTANCPTT